ncbi:MAG: 50S ribosomal protein L5 [Candidatus Liptonbacteria bacterium]|nr:50S ribosomal protein L5 [Candidatus Liptonbacteria bacterium]
MKKIDATTIRRDIRAAIEKIVVDAGVGRLSSQPQFSAEGGEGKGVLAQVMRDLALLTGQKPEVRRAKRSIAGFKVREGQIVGLRVTLRGTRMIDFFRKFVTIVLPRVRDFHGINPRAIDEKGMLNVGIREHLVFPEVNPESSPVSFSLGINIVPKKKVRAPALEAYRGLGVPFSKRN